MLGTVYTLSYGENVFYVGSTIHAEARFFSHSMLAVNGESGLYDFMRSMVDDPKMEVIEMVNVDDLGHLRKLEKFYIEQFRQWGFDLKNVTNNLSKKRRFIPRENRALPDVFDVLTTKQIRDILKISRPTLDALCREGKLTKFKVGGANRFRMSEVEKMMK